MKLRPSLFSPSGAGSTRALARVTTLALGRNRLRDLDLSRAALAALPQLTALDVSHNRLSRLHGVDGGGARTALLPPALAALDARDNALAQCDAVAFAACAPRLQRLALGRNPLRSARGLGALPALTELDLARCAVDAPGALQPLATDRALARLDLSGNPVVRAHGPRLRLMLKNAMPQLETLRLRSRAQQQRRPAPAPPAAEARVGGRAREPAEAERAGACATLAASLRAGAPEPAEATSDPTPARTFQSVSFARKMSEMENEVAALVAARDPGG